MCRFTSFACVAFAIFLSGCGHMNDTKAASGAPTVHYLEIVCPDSDAQCALLAKAHGWSFGEPVADLGQARVATTTGGTIVGVRRPLADHEMPIVRPYIVVDDIEAALQAAESAGATIAYPPTKQGATGTWAIYIANGTQVGLWQHSSDEQ